MRRLLIIALVAAAAAATLDERLAKWKPVDMPFNSAGLSARERQMVDKLVEASQYLDDIYWRQSDPDGLLMINGSRWDLLDENRPFVGTEPMPPGHALYPKDLTRAQMEQYSKQHPEKKEQIYSGYTVVRRQGKDLVTRPYHIEYKQFLDPAAKALRDAAGLSDDAACAPTRSFRTTTTRATWRGST
jgi:hypothetical protein